MCTLLVQIAAFGKQCLPARHALELVLLRLAGIFPNHV